jgi:hypothetical protein
MQHNIDEIIIEHYTKYPKMMIEDFVKLIFQNTFGPSHFSKKPDYTQIASYLIKELTETKAEKNIPKVEYIGHHYYRLSLDLIRDGELSVHELSDMFLKSMEFSSELSDQVKQCYVKKIDALLNLIKNQKIALDYEASVKYVKEMMKDGIKTTHHSDAYQSAYHPAYRVVHHNFIPKSLLKKYQM